MTVWCGCGGKKAYRGWSHAIVAALRNSARFGCAFRPYACPRKAGVVHLTTSTREEYVQRGGRHAL